MSQSFENYSWNKIYIFLPGTVSGKVSFCIVCIAFKAFNALYHLKYSKLRFYTNGVEREYCFHGLGNVYKKVFDNSFKNLSLEMQFSRMFVFHVKICENIQVLLHCKYSRIE